MKALRVDFNLVTAVSGMSMPLHLDALLAYAVTQEHLQSNPDCTDKKSIRSLGENLPLAKAEDGDMWCWKSSALVAEATLQHEMRMWTRKTDAEVMATMLADGSLQRKRALKFPLEPLSVKIDTQRGALKNHFQFIPVRHVKKFSAYCIGDADRIYDLLQTYVTHIGARGRTGFGRIAQEDGGTIQSIYVEEDESANQMWQHRVMPWALDGYVPIQAAHKAPYWAAENKAISFIPENILV